MTTVGLRMDAAAARAFKRAPREDRSKLCALWTVLLREYQESPVSLRVLMDQVGAKAKARGLNARKLESILDARD